MGIAIMAVVIPAFLITAVVSGWLAQRYSSTKMDSTWKFRLLGIVGLLVALILTLVMTQNVPEGENHGWDKLFRQMGTVLFFPLIFGSAVLLIVKLVTKDKNSIFLPFAKGILWASAVSPFVISIGLFLYQDYQKNDIFETICKNATIETGETVIGQATSLAFLTDKFYDLYDYFPSESSKYILNQSHLEFIERPLIKESGLEGKTLYERVRTRGERVRKNPTNDPKLKTEYAYEPTDTITADYIVQSKRVDIEPKWGKTGIIGAVIEIRRRETNKMIAKIQYYYWPQKGASCPKYPRRGPFVYQFIADALNIDNREKP